MIIDASRSRIEKLYRQFEAAREAEKQGQMKKNRLRLVTRQDMPETVQEMPTPAQGVQGAIVPAVDVSYDKHEAEPMDSCHEKQEKHETLEKYEVEAGEEAENTVQTDQTELLQSLLSLINVFGNLYNNDNSQNMETQKQDVQDIPLERTVHRRTEGTFAGSFQEFMNFLDSDTLKVISEFATREHITADEYLSIHSLPFDSNLFLVLLGLREYLDEPRSGYITTFLRVVNVVDLVTSGEINEFIKIFMGV